MSNVITTDQMLVKHAGVFIAGFSRKSTREFLGTVSNPFQISTLEEYISNLSREERDEIVTQIRQNCKAGDQQMIEQLIIPIILNGVFPSDDELEAKLKEIQMEKNIFEFTLAQILLYINYSKKIN